MQNVGSGSLTVAYFCLFATIINSTYRDLMTQSVKLNFSWIIALEQFTFCLSLFIAIFLEFYFSCYITTQYAHIPIIYAYIHTYTYAIRVSILFRLSNSIYSGIQDENYNKGGIWNWKCLRTQWSLLMEFHFAPHKELEQ